jgi:hypothetical protein
MFLPALGTLTLDEFSACTLDTAIRLEVSRLEALATLARDEADRDGWAYRKLQVSSLRRVCSDIRFMRDMREALSPEAEAAVQEAVQRLRHKLPRSAANESVLRAEREAAHAGTGRRSVPRG